MTAYEQVDHKSLEEMRMRCRRSHWFDLSGPPPDFQRTGLFAQAKYVIHWTCQKCTAVRSDAIGANGGLIARRYKYPDGYLYDKDEEPPTSEELRLWFVKRNRALGITEAPKPAKKAKPKLSEQLKQAATRG